MRREKKPTNAFKHGVFAAVTIAPGEDPKEFEKLHADLVREWEPNGATETETILGLANDYWRKRRLQKFLQIKLLRNIANPEHPSYDESNGLLYCAAVLEADPEVGFDEASRGLRADKTHYLKTKFRRGDFKSTAGWGRAIVNEIHTNLLPKSVILDPEPAKIVRLMQSAATLSGDSFKEELALEERLDAMIDKKIRRLLTLKATKPMLGLKSTQRTETQPNKVVAKETPITESSFVGRRVVPGVERHHPDKSRSWRAGRDLRA